MTSTTQPARTATPNMPNSSAKQRTQMNGTSASARTKSVNEPRAPLHDSSNPDRYAHDRLLFLIANMVGNSASVTVKNGDRFTGILSGASLPKDSTEAPAFVLKMTKKVNIAAAQVNGHAEAADEYVGYGDDHVMTFSEKDIFDLNVNNLSLDKVSVRSTNGTTSGFRTDTDISGNLAIRERELQAWQPSAEDASMGSLENGNMGSGRPWDQFEANERLYNVKTDYDERYYNTEIDQSDPKFRERLNNAERVAREIQRETTSNPHIAEERGQKDPAAENMDEEDRFSGVRRDFPCLPATQSNNYVPPAKRAPSGLSTVRGAPVDPAIISSQLARPDSAKANKPSTEVALPQFNNRTETTTLPSTSSPSQPSTEVSGNTGSTANTTPPKVAVPASNANAKEQSSVIDAITSKTGSAARQPGTVPTIVNSATQNVEKQVLDSFKSFANNEKLRIASRNRMSLAKEREVRLNDLKKFASDFKLKTVVPQDMLGILAKDKTKQNEIVEKSKREVEEQKVTPTRQTSTPATPSTGAKPALASAATPSTPFSPTAAIPTGSSKLPPLQAVSQAARPDRNPPPSAGGIVSPRAGPGHLGQRLLAQQQQYQNRGPLSAGPVPPTVPSATSPQRHGSVASVISSTGPRLNAQAMDFKPNAAAASFAPSLNRGSVSSTDKAKARAAPSRKPKDRVSIFGENRPGPASEKRSIREAFNPLARLKKEAETQGRVKDYASNGGIPQAYRTPPTWDTTEENKDKTYLDMWEKTATSQAQAPMPHHQQLPMHLQGTQGAHQIPANHATHNGPVPMPMPNHRFDDPRMQFSPSQSGFPSPRMPPVMVPFPGGQMMTPMPQQFQGQAMAPYTMTPNGQPMAFRPGFVNNNGHFMASPNAHFATPMAMTPSNMGGVVMVPQMPMHAVPNPAMTPGFQHGAGPHAYSSPRMNGAPMMMQQGSQQGHAPGQFVYMQPGQHPGQMGFPMHQPQGPHVRGGVPMMHQNSFQGGPPHFQRQFSSHGVNSYNQPPQSPMAPHAPMPQPQQTPNASAPVEAQAAAADGAK